ncbi:MAG TPA: VWA domain-containing protein [Bryobacteraceae bacterium]|jgi:Ca-activated chloride channel family protein|nr:VWA domain-containing protein [Bryobacteraceae bacterium]
MYRWPVRLLFAAALGAFGIAAWAQFRTEVKLVRVVATVKDPSGQLVGTLQQSDFTIADNGVPQEVKVFARQSDQPLSVALMIDTSGSTAKDLRFETDSAAKFVRALLLDSNPHDAVSLWGFDYDVRQETGFTHRLDQIESKLKTIKGDAGTSLFDAIWFASKDLEPREGRKVMVIVTDGGNTTSYRDSHQALEAAQLADAIIYPVVVLPIKNEAGRNIGGENFLTFIAQGTGGRAFVPTLGAQLDKAFRDIIADLRTEYVLGYYPHNVPLTKNRWHTLQVGVKRPELQVLARNGYYGDSDALAVTSTPEPGVALAAAKKSK